ncbi:hypothetical protein ES703_95671 [subsurface metagenome]
MGRSALSKLREADEMSKEADKIRKRDPGNASSLDDVASKKRSQAIKQWRRHPRRKQDKGIKRVL